MLYQEKGLLGLVPAAFPERNVVDLTQVDDGEVERGSAFLGRSEVALHTSSAGFALEMSEQCVAVQDIGAIHAWPLPCGLFAALR